MTLRFWDELTTEEIGACDRSATAVVLPVAATEQHGPHLPLSTDAVIGRGILDRAASIAGSSPQVLVLPLQTIGKSNEHGDFPGTLSHGADTLIRSWTEIAASVAASGFRRLVIFNSHGGQPDVMRIVAQDLRARLRMLAVTVSWFDLGLPECPFPAAELVHGIHGGAVETSMMLHLAPDLVWRDRIADFPSRSRKIEEEFAVLRAFASPALAWQTQDLNPSGACGDARLADADWGRKAVEHLASRLLALLDEVVRYPLDRLADGPIRRL